MEKAIHLVVVMAFFAVHVVLAAYVTWLFAVRLRNKASVPKSFLRWLRDLFDLLPS